MKFKADFHQLVFFSKIEHAVYMQIENKYSSMEVSAIYTQKWKFAKNQGFSYELCFQILYLKKKKSKTQKTEGKLKNIT